MRVATQLKLDLSHSQTHFQALHNNAHGTVLLWERGAPGAPWRKLKPGDENIPALLAAQVGQPDRYISVNEFHGWRLVRLLKSLRTNYVDIDYKDSNKDIEIDDVLEHLRDSMLPQPSAVVWSGRGMHIYWIHESVPARALPVWQRCQDTLIRALAPLGADPAAKDCARVLRLVGSVNTKNNEEVRGLVLDAQPYEFHHLCNEILGYREPTRTKPKIRDLATERAKRGERIHTGSVYDRWHLVYRDLLKIAEHHAASGGIPEHHRNNWLFLNSVSLSWFANEATLREEVEGQARVWTRGLSDADVKAAIKAPLDRAIQARALKDREELTWDSDPRYKYKRQTLWEMMSPIIPPTLAHELRAIIPDEIKAEHKRESEAKRDRVAEGRHKTRHSESAAVTKPWEAMGVSRRTYYRRQAAGAL